MRLEGPLQAWSSQGKFGIRDTEREPTKSGVIGLLGAAMGMARDDDDTLAALRALMLAVRVDRPGSLLHDYHTAGGGRFRGAPYVVFGVKACIPSDRYYLADASFTAALSGSDALVERLAEALRTPRWPLFLGRRSCPPSVPPLLGMAAGEAQDAVHAAARAERVAPDQMLRLVLEVPAGEDGEPRYDVPLSFADGARRYGMRYVKTTWLEGSRGVKAHAAAEGALP